MKRIFSFILFLSIIIIAITSCKKPTQKFSCDKDIDKFTQINLSSFTNITREELCKYSPDTARSIYNSLLPIQKVFIWKEKLNLIISSENLSQAEKDFIIDLKDRIGSVILNGDSTSINNLNIYIKQNGSVFNWDEFRLGEYFASPYTYAERTGFLQVPIDGAISNSCNCNVWQINSCWGTCSYISDCFYNGPKSGCGFIRANPCNGTCN